MGDGITDRCDDRYNEGNDRATVSLAAFFSVPRGSLADTLIEPGRRDARRLGIGRPRTVLEKVQNFLLQHENTIFIVVVVLLIIGGLATLLEKIVKKSGETDKKEHK